MSTFLQEFFRAGVYKRSQGRISRQVTFAALAVTVLLAFFRLSMVLRSYDPHTSNAAYGLLCYGVPGILLVLGLWTSYRAVNFAGIADFLIAVEAEMNKVSWPNRGELMRASTVVLISILFLGFILAAYDLFWIWVFRVLGIYS